MAFDLFTKKQTSRDWSMGSLLLPASQQKAMFQKMDDVRYDLRKGTKLVSASIFALSGALAFVGIAKVFKAAKIGS